jgi:dTDP-4-dehydrorhamnose 3,5-epimerase
MNVIPTSLPGVLLLEPRVFPDARGFFLESYNRQAFAAAGISCEFVQDNHSRSCRHTLRGMHYQLPPRAQDKLVRVLAGEIYDVAVDLRPDSPTFGRWEGFHLSADSFRMLFIPKGFAHGFCVLSETADLFYKCSDLYAPELQGGFRWDDPAVGITWPVTAPLLSDRDRAHPPFVRPP